jgi:hypothetical protein
MINIQQDKHKLTYKFLVISILKNNIKSREVLLLIINKNKLIYYYKVIN